MNKNRFNSIALDENNDSEHSFPLRINLIVLTTYIILALILTYPLAVHLNTHVPGSDTWAYDEYTFVWNLWLFKYSLLDLNSTPLHTDLVFFPVGMSFVLYTYVLLNALLSIPLQPFLALSTISNLLMLASTIFSGYTTYLLILYLLSTRKHRDDNTNIRERAAAFIAGAIYAFAANRAIYLALGHYDMASTTWIPLYILYFIKTHKERKWKNAILAGLFMTFALLSEMIVGVFLAMFSLILLLLPPMKSKREGWHSWQPRIGRFAVMTGTSIITYAPVLYYIIKEMREGFVLSGWGDAVKLSADLFSFITPPALHPWWGTDWESVLANVKAGTARFADVNTVFVGYGVLICALFGILIYRRRVSAWLVSAITFAILSLGPVLQINGQAQFDFDGIQTAIPLPFIALHYIPFVRGNRAPNRFSVVLMLALAVLVGYASYWILRKFSTRFVLPLTGLILIIALVEHVSIPLPLTDARVPNYYYQLAQEPDDFAVLLLPLGWRNSFGTLGAENTQIQYYQTVHHKKMLGGNASRHAPFKTEYFHRLPLFKAITDVELYQEVSEELVNQARAQAPDLMYLYDIRYLIINSATPNRPPYSDTRQRTIDLARKALPLEPNPIYEQNGLVVYSVIQPEESTNLVIKFGSSEYDMYRGAGWGDNEEIDGVPGNWAVENEATIFLPIRTLSDYKLTLNMLPFKYPNAPCQHIAVELNGHDIAELPLNDGWNNYEVTLPASHLKKGLNRVTLKFSNLISPREAYPADLTIGTTGVAVPVDIEVNSSKDFAYITVGKDDASAHRRGYNIAVIDENDGHVIDQRGFDTWANHYEAQRMAEYIAAVPDGRIVVAAMQGDGALNLTDDAVQALHSIGARQDSRQAAQHSHALIGVKGAAAGAAAEVAVEGNSYIRIGRHPDARPRAAAVSRIDLQIIDGNTN